MQSTFAEDSPGSLDDGGSGNNKSSVTDVANLNITSSTNLNTIQQLSLTTKTWHQRIASDERLRNRILAHAIMLIVAVMAIGLSRLELSWGTISAVRPLKQDITELPTPDVEDAGQPLTLSSQLNFSQNNILFRAAVPNTTILENTQLEEQQLSARSGANSNASIQTYFVDTGDTISGIAAKFGIAVETIIWANQDLENNPDLLSIGQQLIILPVDGVYHQVGGGDTIEGIASTFKTDPQLIIDDPINNLDPENLLIVPGQWLVVPGGSKPFVPRAVTAYSGPVPTDATSGTGIFGWPASGEITQGYFGYHPGVDIGGWTGAPVLAADSGYVVAAGWDNTGYGLSVVIDHSNGFQTLYAHMEDYYVSPGQNVAKGQQIGEIGTSGNSTGPHLHFEIRHGTVQRNPYGFLP